jgi:hypothetical protein
LRGFLKAPITGTYKFYLSSDDEAEFFIQTTPLSTSKPTVAGAYCYCNPYRNYWYEYLNNPTYTI